MSQMRRAERRIESDRGILRRVRRFEHGPLVAHRRRPAGQATRDPVWENEGAAFEPQREIVHGRDQRILASASASSPALA